MFTLHAQSGFPWKNQGQPLSQSPFSFREQSFKRWEIPMILSVLSSPALVSGLMVVRAKNPVHFVLFFFSCFFRHFGFSFFFLSEERRVGEEGVSTCLCLLGSG
jgi:hypothetical protein